jgi:hypothetical protein
MIKRWLYFLMKFSSAPEFPASLGNIGITEGVMRFLVTVAAEEITLVREM